MLGRLFRFTREHLFYYICALPPCFLRVRCSRSIVEPNFLFFLSIVFYQHPPLPIFRPPPIVSYPSSRSPPISAVAFPFSSVLYVFPPLLSLLVCLHTSLPSGLPISSCFSPIFLLGYIASQPLSYNPHHFCLLQAQSHSVLLEHPLPFLQHFL